jgi:hypothetical protein
MTCSNVVFEPSTGHGNEQREYWTLECLIDQLFLILCSIRQTEINDNGRSVTIRKYYAQARELMKWIPIARLPSNEFVINISDIRQPIRKEIENQLSLIFDPQTCLECRQDHSFKNGFERVKRSIDDFLKYFTSSTSGIILV